MVHGHADLHFVQANAEGAIDTQAVIRRQQQKRTLGDRMPRAGDDDGEGVRQQATGQRRAGCHQRHRFLGAGGHHLQIVPARQNPGLTGNDHHRAISHRLIQRSVERRNHVRRDGIDLAVAQGQGRDTVFEVVGNQLTHDANPFNKVGQKLLTAIGKVKRHD
ncbi:hypothetical protein D3C84_836710 [compost metagenome]